MKQKYSVFYGDQNIMFIHTYMTTVDTNARTFDIEEINQKCLLSSLCRHVKQSLPVQTCTVLLLTVLCIFLEEP